jgi:hypothetical protein
VSRNTEHPTPARLAPFLAQWDYMAEQMTARLAGLTDEEFLWEPAPGSWTVERKAGRGLPTAPVWNPSAEAQPPRTLAWSIGHLGIGTTVRADWLTGSHSLDDEQMDWPMTADDGLRLLQGGLSAWRSGIGTMTDEDLDTVGRSAYPGGLDTELPLIEIVWWVNKELLEHAAEIWYVRDLYAALHAPRV